LETVGRSLPSNKPGSGFSSDDLLLRKLDCTVMIFSFRTRKKKSEESLALSVIIVNYNAGTLLANCVRAVPALPVDPEVFISDNGSTDENLTRIRVHQGEEPRLTIPEHGSGLGFAQGMGTCSQPKRSAQAYTGRVVLNM